MQRSTVVAACAAVFVAAFAGHARADFAGQTILGPLTNGSVATGTTLGASDDNDGFTSGTHIFDIWDGGDHVYALDWIGGSMLVSLESFDGSDNDLFIYRPGSLDDSGDYSIAGAFDSVSIDGAGAGQYFIVIDSTFFSEGSYRLTVAPAPSAASLGLIGMGLAGVRRRRD
jgi:MYXO-CTERM domain-containing protein